MLRTNKLIFSSDGEKVRVVFKNDSETTNYGTKTDAIKAVFNLFNEGKIEGEEYIKWLGLILGDSNNLAMGELLKDDFMAETKNVGLSILYTLKVSFFAMCWSGKNIGYIQVKGGEAQSYLVTSKDHGYKQIWSLSIKQLIDSNEVEKLIEEISMSPLDETDSPEYEGFSSN